MALEKLRRRALYALHTLSAVVVVSAEVADYLGRFDWTQLVAPDKAALILLAVNVLGILLHAARSDAPAVEG